MLLNAQGQEYQLVVLVPDFVHECESMSCFLIYFRINIKQDILTYPGQLVTMNLLPMS